MNASRPRGPSADGRRRCALLVRNGHVVTMAGEEPPVPGGVAIDGRTIVAVGTDDELARAFEPARVLDARGGLVHPGLVEAHYHATLHLTRGALPDHAPGARGESARASFGGFVSWINALDDEDEHASALLACVEMVRNGVTCFMDPGTAFSPGAVAAAAEAVGIRASVADPFLWDVEGGLAMASRIDRAPPARARALELLGSELGRNRDDGLVRGHVALYGSGSASEELTAAAKACADEAGVVLTQHQNLDPADAAFDEARFGRRGLVHFAERGLLGANCTFMHMNVLRDDERAAVVRSGMSVVWHPGNYLFYGISASVPSPMASLRSEGVTVAFGTDVAKAWSFGDLGLLGYLVARMGHEFLSAEEILELQTRAGARAVGLADRIGSLEPGKRADLVVRTSGIPEMSPGLDPVAAAVLVARSKSVDSVVCDGQVVVEHGRPTRVEEESVLELASASARRVRARIGL